MNTEFIDKSYIITYSNWFEFNGNCPHGKIKYLPPQDKIKNDETSN